MESTKQSYFKMNRFSGFNEKHIEHEMYKYISKLIVDSVYFGPYPPQAMISDLENNGFNIIVNLTEDDDVLYKYTTSLKIFKYPIQDRSFPKNFLSYCQFIYTLCEEIKNNKKVYIHCRSGWTRSTIVAVSILCVLYDYDLKTSKQKVFECLRKRHGVNPRWLITTNSPLNNIQEDFLLQIHRNIYLNNTGYYNRIFTFEDIEKIKEMKSKDIKDYLSSKFSSRFFYSKIQGTYLKKFIFQESDDYYKYNHYLNDARKEIIMKSI